MCRVPRGVDLSSTLLIQGVTESCLNCGLAGYFEAGGYVDSDRGLKVNAELELTLAEVR